MVIQYLQLTGGALLQYPTLHSELLFLAQAVLLSSDCTSAVNVIFGSFVSMSGWCQFTLQTHHSLL